MTTATNIAAAITNLIANMNGHGGFPNAAEKRLVAALEPLFADREEPDRATAMRDDHRERLEADLQAANARVHDLFTALGVADMPHALERIAELHANQRSNQEDGDLRALGGQINTLQTSLADRNNRLTQLDEQIRSLNDDITSIGTALGVQPSTAAILDAISSLESQLARERELTTEAIARMDVAVKRAKNLEVDLSHAQQTYADDLDDIRSPVDASILPDGYRIDGPLVTNDTISVLATSEAVIIRTSTGVGCWAPLDAVKIAIAEKEKRT